MPKREDAAGGFGVASGRNEKIFMDQHPPVGVSFGGFKVFKSLQKAPIGGSRDRFLSIY